MVETDLSNGIYMVWQKSSHKGVDHYGVLDVGNCSIHHRSEICRLRNFVQVPSRVGRGRRSR